MSVVHEIVEGVQVEVSADSSQLQLRGPVPDQTHGPIRGEHCPQCPSTNPSSPDQADRAGAGLAVVLLEGPHAGAEHGVHGGARAVGGLGPEGGPAQLLPCQHAAPRPLLEPVTWRSTLRYT